jgi:hypothetical protein
VVVAHRAWPSRARIASDRESLAAARIPAVGASLVPRGVAYCYVEPLGRCHSGIDVDVDAEPEKGGAIPATHLQAAPVGHALPALTLVKSVLVKVLFDIAHHAQVRQNGKEFVDRLVQRGVAGRYGRSELGGSEQLSESNQQELGVCPPPEKEVVVFGLFRPEPAALQGDSSHVLVGEAVCSLEDGRVRRTSH